jgi:hypothetical protein
VGTYSRTAKNNDFEIFARVVAMMIQGEHLSKEGFEKIKELAGVTNRRKARKTVVSKLVSENENNHL